MKISARFQNKFLLNRQKIFNPLEIHSAVASYFTHLPTADRQKFFYRLEWYKIGISVPMLVYSEFKPQMQLMPECQLLETSELVALPVSAKEYDFSIFAVPGKDANLENEINEPEVINWLQNYLDGAATVTEAGLGPNNCLYYQKKDREHHQQTVTIKGSLRANDAIRLDLLRRQPAGNCSELGCGLLLLTENSA